MNFLTHIDNAKREIMAADSLVKVKDLWNKADAMRALGQVTKDPELINYATEFKLRCERRLGEMLAIEVTHGGDPAWRQSSGVGTLDNWGLTKKVSSRAQRIASVPEAVFEAVIAEAKEEEKELTRAAVEKLINTAQPRPTPPLPNGVYRVLYADPPWQYGDQLAQGYGRAARHYPTMSIEQLCTLPVKTLIASDSVLFLWVTSPLLEECFMVIKAWGFKYKASFIWNKLSQNWAHYNSASHELLLLATKGSCLPESNKDLPPSVVSIKRTKLHSEKPEYFRDMIDKLYPPNGSDRIELFARKDLPPHWKGWGNETGNDSRAAADTSWNIA